MLTLEEGHLNLLIDDARTRYPVEACGVLAGKGTKVSKVYPLRNIERSAFRYFMDPEEQVKVLEEIAGNGWDVVGVYHSHPGGPPWPSEEDLKEGTFPHYTYLIIDLEDFDSPRCGAYRVSKGKIREVTLRIAK